MTNPAHLFSSVQFFNEALFLPDVLESRQECIRWKKHDHSIGYEVRHGRNKSPEFENLMDRYRFSLIVSVATRKESCSYQTIIMATIVLEFKLLAAGTRSDDLGQQVFSRYHVGAAEEDNIFLVLARKKLLKVVHLVMTFHSKKGTGEQKE